MPDDLATEGLLWADLDDPDIIEDSQAPPLLYHYTDTRGFAGIVTGGGRLHATHHRFLNDLGELAFGGEIVRQVLREFQRDLGADVLARTIARVEDLLKGDAFVACFSESHTVLSQWRAYAADASGFCLGLRPRERLTAYGDDQDSFWNHLVKCTYGVSEAGDFLRCRIQRQIERASGSSSAERRAEFLVSKLARMAWRCAERAKHEHFREEAEWRIHVGAPASEVNYRVGPLGITPFLATEALALEEVWIGPRAGRDPLVAKRAVQGFLRTHKIDATIELWDSPFAR